MKRMLPVALMAISLLTACSKKDSPVENLPDPPVPAQPRCTITDLKINADPQGFIVNQSFTFTYDSLTGKPKTMKDGIATYNYFYAQDKLGILIYFNGRNPALYDVVLSYYYEESRFKSSSILFFNYDQTGAINYQSTDSTTYQHNTAGQLITRKPLAEPERAVHFTYLPDGNVATMSSMNDVQKYTYNDKPYDSIAHYLPGMPAFYAWQFEIPGQRLKNNVKHVAYEYGGEVRDSAHALSSIDYDYVYDQEGKLTTIKGYAESLTHVKETFTATVSYSCK